MEAKEFDFEFPRGDTVPVKFSLTDEEKNILVPTSEDEIYFTLKRNYNKQEVILQKKLSTGEIKNQDNELYFVLEHEDTANLNYGSYVYDIQLKSGDYVKTLVIGTIELTNEATWIKNE